MQIVRGQIGDGIRILGQSVHTKRSKTHRHEEMKDLVNNETFKRATG